MRGLKGDMSTGNMFLEPAAKKKSTFYYVHFLKVSLKGHPYIYITVFVSASSGVWFTKR